MRVLWSDAENCRPPQPPTPGPVFGAGGKLRGYDLGEADDGWSMFDVSEHAICGGSPRSVMSVSLAVGRERFEIGSADFLNAFFSTIAARLERGRWGERFPAVMRDLYAGRLPAAGIGVAVRELQTIRSELAEHSPSEVVWDFNDKSARPPWGDRISSRITSLANYFVTSDGKDLFEVLFAALDAARNVDKELSIE